MTTTDVQTVFAYWQQVFGHPQAKFDKSRQRWIQQALAMGYGVAECCQAIDGCALTPHNIGENDKGERYDGVHIVFKSADQIDRFIRNAKSPPKILNKSEQRLQSNLAAAHAWLNNHPKAEEG